MSLEADEDSSRAADLTREIMLLQTDCSFVLSPQTTFHIQRFSLLLDAASRLCVSARHTDTHTQLYTHSHAPHNRELTY